MAKKKCYLISYDHSGDDYEPLYKAIKDLGAWAHLTESSWAVFSDAKAERIRKGLQKHLAKGSRLIVALYGGEGSWFNLKCQFKGWLEKNRK